MRILFLDDDEQRHQAFERLSIGHQVHHVRTAQEAIEALQGKPFDLVALDHDLGGRHWVDSNDPEGTGYTVAKAMTEDGRLKRPREVIVHSFNHPAARRMVDRLSHAGFKVQAAPFGTWSL